MPSNLIEPPLEERRRGGRFAARKPERDSGTGRTRFPVEPREKLLSLVESALKHPNLGKTGSRADAPRSLTGSRQLLDRREEFHLRGVDAAVGGEDVRAARPAEREEDRGVVLPDEIFENSTPLLRTFQVARPLAREHHRATDVCKSLKACRLTACGRGHRLIELRETFVDLSA